MIRLIAYKASSNNVGDDYSQFLFERLLPSGTLVTDADCETVLFGVGSILDRRFQAAFAEGAKEVHVFGSGARSRETLPDFSGASWIFHHVRGPLTAAAIPDRHVEYITDPGLLAPVLHPAKGPSGDGPVGIVPYYGSSMEDWQVIADRLNCRMISTHLGVEDFLSELSSCSRILSESMHGAIFADAYRIPWRPIAGMGVHAEKDTQRFKWTDWATSMGVTYEPIHVRAFGASARTSLASKGKLAIKRELVVRTLRQVLDENAFQLSSDHVLADRTERMRARAEALKAALGV